MPLTESFREGSRGGVRNGRQDVESSVTRRKASRSSSVAGIASAGVHPVSGFFGFDDVGQLLQCRRSPAPRQADPSHRHYRRSSSPARRQRPSVTRWKWLASFRAVLRSRCRQRPAGRYGLRRPRFLFPCRALSFRLCAPFFSGREARIDEGLVHVNSAFYTEISGKSSHDLSHHT